MVNDAWLLINFVQSERLFWKLPIVPIFFVQYFFMLYASFEKKEISFLSIEN